MTDKEPAYFNLSIDGAHVPDHVFFPAAASGGMLSVSGDIPFGLIIQ